MSLLIHVRWSLALCHGKVCGLPVHNSTDWCPHPSAEAAGPKEGLVKEGSLSQAWPVSLHWRTEIGGPRAEGNSHGAFCITQSSPTCPFDLVFHKTISWEFMYKPEKEAVDQGRRDRVNQTWNPTCPFLREENVTDENLRLINDYTAPKEFTGKIPQIWLLWSIKTFLKKKW